MNDRNVLNYYHLLNGETLLNLIGGTVSCFLRVFPCSEWLTILTFVFIIFNFYLSEFDSIFGLSLFSLLFLDKIVIMVCCSLST